MDAVNTAFMLICSALVLLMTPGLAFFYGGFTDKKNVVGLIFQSLICMGWVTILWWAVGYSLTFSGGAGGIIGNLDQAFLRGVTAQTLFDPTKIPLYVLFVYQLMFAIITPALMSGALVGRIRVPAYLAFVAGWLFLVYIPAAHMTWGGGLFAKMGFLDFAGGLVVHAISGFGALGAVFFLGKRKNQANVTHNIPLIALGASLLWVGWFGFNAGSELAVDAVTSNAFLNTQLATAVAAFTWFIIDYFRTRKPKLVSFCVGAVAGLVVITPACGFISPKAAVVLGLAAGSVCYAGVMLKNMMGWDDALDVWGVHGVGGITGAVLLGVFASSAVNSVVAAPGGLYKGGVDFFIKQAVIVIGSAIYSMIVSYVMLLIINMITPVRTTENEESQGYDAGLHGEPAYQD